MKIGFVAEPYEESNASGMGYVVRELIKNLVAESTGKHDFVVFSSRPVSRRLLPGQFENILMPKGFVKQFFWYYRLKDDIDVLLFVAPLLPFIVPRRIKTVIICQELASQKIKPGTLRDKVKAFIRDHILMPRCLARASIIVAASKATQTDILRFYTVPHEKVPVVYDGFQDIGRFKDKATPIDEKMRPYFFFAGVVKYRKNVHGIVNAFMALRKRTNVDCKLVIAGNYGGEYYRDIMRRLEENGLASDVFFVGYATEGKLYSLYKNASAFVFPSINEGFGMPPVEAMSLGIPVITSKISSMAEVAGGAALLVDPFNIDELSAAMETILLDENVRSGLISKGFERSKIFSWREAARAYLSFIESL